jgi:hypothetical protein
MMRVLLRPFAHRLRWPVRIGVFVIHLMHHLAAFFAWMWMLIHVVGSMATAGLQASKLWEMRVVEDIWRQGMQYFSLAGGLEWQKILGLALIPACLLAMRNAYNAYEQFHAWVHEHKGAPHG